MKLEEIANKIDLYLKRFESDPIVNHKIDNGLNPYYMSRCYSSGSRIFVTYISYQGPCSLKKDDAIKYLKALDEGFVGKHFKVIQLRGV